MVNHQVKPDTPDEEAEVYTHALTKDICTGPIQDHEFTAYLEALAHGHSGGSAAAMLGRSSSGMREYAVKTEDRKARVRRARALWTDFHLDTLRDKKDDGQGSSARTRRALGALASVDKRYRKEVHVGGVINNNTVILADPRPPGSIGNPDRYAIAQADVIEGTASTPRENTPPPVPAPISPKKGTPIL